MRWLVGVVASILVPSMCVALEPAVIMDCEVKYQSVIESDEGKPKLYSN